MFKRAHHNQILALLHALDCELFAKAECYFAGGTAIALSLNEFRESVDVDFLCASTDGYRLLRSTVFDGGFAALTRQPVETLRELKTDQYGIRTIVKAADGRPLKFEIVREARVPLGGAMSEQFGVPLLSQTDLFAEKLLANEDRWGDRSQMSRDIIDLAMMIEHWGPIPADALHKAQAAYGPAILKAFGRATRHIFEQPDYLVECLTTMGMDPALDARIQTVLRAELKRIAPDQLALPHADGAILADAAVAGATAPPSSALTQFLAQNGATLQPLNTENGRYAGKVLWVDPHYTVQDLGHGTVAVHASGPWHPQPVAGQNIRVQYHHGFADWALRTQRPSHAQGR